MLIYKSSSDVIHTQRHTLICGFIYYLQLSFSCVFYVLPLSERCSCSSWGCGDSTAIWAGNLLISFLANDDGFTCADSYVRKNVSLASLKKKFLDGVPSWIQSCYKGKMVAAKICNYLKCSLLITWNKKNNHASFINCSMGCLLYFVFCSFMFLMRTSPSMGAVWTNKSLRVWQQVCCRLWLLSWNPCGHTFLSLDTATRPG